MLERTRIWRDFFLANTQAEESHLIRGHVNDRMSEGYEEEPYVVPWWNAELLFSDSAIEPARIIEACSCDLSLGEEADEAPQLNECPHRWYRW